MICGLRIEVSKLKTHISSDSTCLECYERPILFPAAISRSGSAGEQTRIGADSLVVCGEVTLWYSKKNV